ncbi:hypothetical protein BHU24_05065 [Bacillus pseudomycoides]|uniref:Uncharacterized protein n=1 Tax=Bacillus pseudomycoides TaxID=64104 RepID=A0AAJ3R7S5_9BACI|nr:hypothetical protein [Bacillus pseudomycoides]MBD5797259.1 hypothetical protein [Bacillus pseudomycoides]MDR4329403.1 hypothetical protein [Bacillus pseudomycoides]MED1477500.1 hypothetical protein [Bacillus pseudomycoides]MED1538490.1 hypothetical protein [Bacillus pseudomycoides]PEO84212.1 hypothetical protein CN571_23545 [Bacillus pseudomycoides]
MDFPKKTNLFGRVFTFFEEEKWLAFTGLLGFLLGIVCAIFIGIYGAIINPEGDLSKALSFNFALGLFLLTTAAILPFSGLTSKKRIFFRRSYILFSLYSYGIETIQHFRGINPRFSKQGHFLDAIFGSLFGLIAIAMILYYVVLAWKFFCSGSMNQHSIFILSIRYGMISTILAFVAGLWMIIIQDRFTGIHGNIIWLHGLGFHGLQAIPLIACFLHINHHSSKKTQRHLIHIAGFSWLMAVLLVGLQTILGYSIFKLTTIMIICYGFLLLWSILFMLAFLIIFQKTKNN